MDITKVNKFSFLAGRASCQQIIRKRNAHALRFWLRKRFDVDVGAAWAAVWLERATFFSYMDDDTWAMWFNNRLRESGFGWLFGGREGHGYLNWEDIPSAVMHVFFIHIHETEEQLARLKRGEDAYEEVMTRVASSRISRTPLLVLEPIDRVAARVVKRPWWRQP